MKKSEQEHEFYNHMMATAWEVVEQARLLEPYNYFVAEDLVRNLYAERELLSLIPTTIGVLSPKQELYYGVFPSAQTYIEWNNGKPTAAQINFSGTYLRMNGIQREGMYYSFVNSLKLGWVVRHEAYHLFQSVHFPREAIEHEKRMVEKLEEQDVGAYWLSSSFEEAAERYAYQRMMQSTSSPLKKLYLMVYEKQRKKK